MIKEVVKKGSPLLRTKCSPVTDFSAVQKIIDDLIDTIEYLKTTHEFKRGIGLSAPQIGETLRVSVAEYRGRKYVLVNPEIIEHSESKKPIKEGCISFLEYRAFVERYVHVKVKAFDRKGKEFTVEGKGDFAMLLQHEIDHLNGVLYFDHLPNGEKDLIPVEELVSKQK